jgi:L-amino acid N-acyltransferase YncA
MSEAAVMQRSVRLRPSQDADLDAIQAIYAHHVLTGLGSFEEVPPDIAEMARRRAATLALNLPYLVAEAEDGRVIGYAYAAPYRTRSAYRYTVEDSIYVAADAARRGVGQALLAALIERCTALGYRQMVAVIGDSGNAGSIALHASQGFVRTGLLPSVGCKFGRWVDSVLMQRPLGPGDREQPPAR